MVIRTYSSHSTRVCLYSSWASSAVRIIGSAPELARKSLVSAVLTICPNQRLIISTIGRGVPAGRKTPHHKLISMGTPGLSHCWNAGQGLQALTCTDRKDLESPCPFLSHSERWIEQCKIQLAASKLTKRIRSCTIRHFNSLNACRLLVEPCHDHGCSCRYCISGITPFRLQTRSEFDSRFVWALRSCGAPMIQ